MTTRRRVALVLTALAFGLTLAGCGDADDGSAASEQASGNASTEASPTTPKNSGPSTQTPAAPTGSAYTLRYADQYKTVITFTPQEIEVLTGRSLRGASGSEIDAAARVFAEPRTWQAYDDTAADADLIAAAGARDRDDIRRVLTAESKGGDVGLKLYVGHHHGHSEAHFNPNH